jgi:hypothetical protein
VLVLISSATIFEIVDEAARIGRLWLLDPSVASDTAYVLPKSPHKPRFLQFSEPLCTLRERRHDVRPVTTAGVDSDIWKANLPKRRKNDVPADRFSILFLRTRYQ